MPEIFFVFGVNTSLQLPILQWSSGRGGTACRGSLKVLGGGPFLVVSVTSEHHCHIVGGGNRGTLFCHAWKVQNKKDLSTKCY